MTFFYVFTSFLLVIYLYTGFRTIPSLNNKVVKILFWLVLIGTWTALVTHFYFRITQSYPKTAQILAWIGYTSLGPVSYLFCLALIRDLFCIISLGLMIIKKLFGRKKRTTIFTPERRQFLYRASGYSFAALSLSSSVYGMACALQKPRVVDLSIPLDPAHKKLSGLTLIQFTDLHIGPTIKYPYVKAVCDTIRDLKGDIIVFTGDLVDGSVDHLSADVEPLRHIHAPLGKFFITGNHEYYSGVNDWLDMAKLLGFTPLVNEHRLIRYNNHTLTMAGVTDIRGGAFMKKHVSNPHQAARGCPADSYKLLLAHQPTSIYEAANAGFDLQLSGHTHGGQYFPFGYFVRLEHPFVKGMFQHQNTKLYVSQGTGYWGPPVRVGTFPEITRITLL